MIFLGNYNKKNSIDLLFYNQPTFNGTLELITIVSISSYVDFSLILIDVLARSGIFCV